MNPDRSPVTELHQRAMAALAQRREAEAVELWKRIVEAAPDDVVGNTGLGRWALKNGAFDEALLHFGRVARADPRDPRHWINLAVVHQRRGDAQAEQDALYEALKADPQDLMALLMRGALYERTGRREAAEQAYVAATIVAPPIDRLTPDLRAMLARAQEVRRDHERRFAAFMDQALESSFRDNAGEPLDRFRLSLDIMLGRKRRYDARPSRYFVPQLAPVEFFERGLFPWLDEVEAATPAIRAEFLAVLHADEGFAPYIQYGLDEPVEQWAELNHSPRWSAYHLWKDGAPVAEHVARCPQTVRALGATPLPDQPGRTPTAMFSLLKPRTVIPPHEGASNARLVCHLPLIVPDGCSFRVGNTVRPWVPGKAWVFDDTINHEARNDSDQLRVVLIWDTWHPALSPAERRMITAMNAALNAFSGADPAFGG